MEHGDLVRTIDGSGRGAVLCHVGKNSYGDNLILVKWDNGVEGQISEKHLTPDISRIVTAGTLVKIADYGVFKVATVNKEKNLLYVKMKFYDGTFDKQTMLVDLDDFVGQVKIIRA